MIFDRLENAALYAPLSPRLALALDYLRKMDFSSLQPGKQELDGDRLYALLLHYETRLKKGLQWEAHRRYVDLQYILEGVEQMGYAHVRELRTAVPYDEAKDAELLKGRGAFLTARPGMFAVFWPQDAHIPGVALKTPQTVRKVVVKVLLG